ARAALTRQTALPDHLVAVAPQHGPQPESIPAVVVALLLQPLLNPGIAERALIGDHRDRILQDRLQGGQIALIHLAQPQPLRLEDHWFILPGRSLSVSVSASRSQRLRLSASVSAPQSLGRSRIG